MKNIIILTMGFILFFSCKKESVSEYMGVSPEIDSINISDNFPLDGTIWVISKISKGFQSYEANDTIIFHKKFYDMVINGDIVSNDGYSYSLYKTMDLGNTYDLTIYGYTPFGGYAWSSSLTQTFIDENKILLVKFNNISTPNLYITASFNRIK